MGKRIRDNTQAGRNYLFMDESSEKLLKERPDEPPPIEGSVSTTIDYSLRLRNTPPPSAGQLVAVAVGAAVFTVPCWVWASPVSLGITGGVFFFFGRCVGRSFARRFGGWGFCILY